MWREEKLRGEVLCGGTMLLVVPCPWERAGETLVAVRAAVCWLGEKLMGARVARAWSDARL